MQEENNKRTENLLHSHWMETDQDLNIMRINYSLLCYLFHSPCKAFLAISISFAKILLAHLSSSDSWMLHERGNQVTLLN